MAKAGQQIHNPCQKERVVFRQTARETDGRLLRLEMFASPEGCAARTPSPASGRALRDLLRARVHGEARALGAGESMIVPADTPHTWWVDG